jgi:hypothetical protein
MATKLVLEFVLDGDWATSEELTEMSDDEVIELAGEDWLAVIEGASKRVERAFQPTKEGAGSSGE